MTSLREAAQQALEALELEATDPPLPETAAAMDALRAALAEPVQPVAWTTGWHGGHCVIRAADPAAILPIGIALYTAPPQRKPLTEENVAKIMDFGQYGRVPAYAMNFVRAIEAAHGIGDSNE